METKRVGGFFGGSLFELDTGVSVGKPMGLHGFEREGIAIGFDEVVGGVNPGGGGNLTTRGTFDAAKESRFNILKTRPIEFESMTARKDDILP